MHSSSLRVQCIHGHTYQNGAKHGWALLSLSCHVLPCADMGSGSGQGVLLQCIHPQGGCTEHQCSQMHPCLPAVTPRIPTSLVDVGFGLMLVHVVTQTVRSKAPHV